MFITASCSFYYANKFFFLFEARHAHLKKCASTFKISPVALMEGIKVQKSDYGIQLARQVVLKKSNNILF